MHFTRPGENLFTVTKSSRFLNFTRAQDGYFLFARKHEACGNACIPICRRSRTREMLAFLIVFIFRIATIKDAVVKITINSSYVLISIILSDKLGSDGSTSPDYLDKYIKPQLTPRLLSILPTLQPCGSSSVNQFNT